jgi:hypothetical protein
MTKITVTTTLKFLFFLVFLGAYKASAAERVKILHKFPFVGVVKFTNGPVCTGFLVTHGIMATAKHCFSHHDIDEFNIESKNLHLIFPKKGGNIDFHNTLIEKKDILKLVLDSGSNDLAYIIYKREKTLNEIDIPAMKLNLEEDIVDQAQIYRVGFPMGENHVFDKVQTSHCQFTGKTDFFRPTITDPGYEGLLYDTDCPAWFGDSGGPIFEENQDTKELTIHGVLTHTFEVNFAGEIEEMAKKRDSIGEYVETSNFSPFRLADDFQQTLDEEEKLFQERNPEETPTLPSLAKNNKGDKSETSTENIVQKENPTNLKDIPLTKTSSDSKGLSSLWGIISKVLAGLLKLLKLLLGF